MNAKFERRTLLGGTLAALATAATAPAWAEGGASAPAPGFWHQPSKLNRQDRVFLHRGLTHGAWVRSGPQDGWYPSAKLLTGAGFTMPQFYAEHLAESAQHKLLYSEDVMRGLHHPTWALARAPYGEQNLTNLPDPRIDWMSPEMKKHANNLFTVCFGDEENFSTELRDYLAVAMQKLRREHPWVLTHTNQWGGEFSEAQLTDYIRTVQPDLLTWDRYSWMAGGSATPSNTELYQRIEQYRRFALAGPDGTGASPLTFGQYTIGFRMSPPPQPGVTTSTQRRVFISESQQNLFPYMTWAGGGKWLSLFRWELDEDYYNPVKDIHWETDGLFMTDADENPLPAYYRYQRINRDMRIFSPYLVRMRSRAIALQRGYIQSGEPSPAVSGLSAWTPAQDPSSGLVAVEAANVGTANNGHRGDVFIGTFGQLPDMSAGENRGVLADRAAASAFMLVNAMHVYNNEPTDAHGTGGSGRETRQRLTVTVDPSTVKAGTRARALSLHTLDRRSGRPVPVRLKRVGHHLQFTVDLDGGAGELFIWG